MAFLSDALALIGVHTVLLAIITGAMMGFYLASINGFIRVRSLRRSLITNLVAATSFLYPIALMRELIHVDNLSWVVWFAMWLLLIAFTMTAEIANWLFCHRAGRNS